MARRPSQRSRLGCCRRLRPAPCLGLPMFPSARPLGDPMHQHGAAALRSFLWRGRERHTKKARCTGLFVSSRQASSLACLCADSRSPAWSSYCSLCRLDWWRGGGRHRCHLCGCSPEQSGCLTSHRCASWSSCGSCCLPGSKTLRCGYLRLWPAPMCMPKLPLSGSLFSSF